MLPFSYLGSSDQIILKNIIEILTLSKGRAQWRKEWRSRERWQRLGHRGVCCLDTLHGKASSTKPIAPSPGPQTGCNSPATMIWREISIGKNLVSTIRKKFTNTSTNIDHGRADTRLRNVCLGKVCLLLLSYIFLLHIMFATTWQIVFHKQYFVCPTWQIVFHKHHYVCLHLTNVFHKHYYVCPHLTTQTRRIILFALPAPDRELRLSGWQMAWYLKNKFIDWTIRREAKEKRQ